MNIYTLLDLRTEIQKFARLWKAENKRRINAFTKNVVSQKVFYDSIDFAKIGRSEPYFQNN